MITRLVGLFIVAQVMMSYAGVTGRRQRHTCTHRKDQSQFNSFLWTIKRDPPSYLFGTIHVPYTRVWHFITDNTKRAFQRSQHIYFELDLTNPYTIADLAKCQLLPHGRNLSQVIPADIYRRLKEHLGYIRSQIPSWLTSHQKQRGLYADYLFNAITGNWERKRPVWVMLMINSLTESDIRSRGIPVLDLFLAQEAERMEKQTGAVEQVEEQCLPLNHLNLSQVVFALNQTLWRHEAYRLRRGSVPFTTDDLIYHYNCGDLNDVIFNRDASQLPNLLNSSLPARDLHMAKFIDDYFRRELIHKRNERIAERVTRLLRAHPNRSMFFAFGAGHFLGNNTIIGRLQEEGFNLEYTQPNATDVLTPACARSKCRFRKVRKSFKRRNRKKSYRVMSADYPMPPLLVQGHVEYSIHRNHDKKGRRKHTRYTPHFNDLWVKLETTQSAGELEDAPNKFSPARRRSSHHRPASLPVVNHGGLASLTMPSIPYTLPLVILFLLSITSL